MNVFRRVFSIAILSLLIVSSGMKGLMAQTPEDDELLKEATTKEIQDIVESYEGEKVVLLNVWATWCGPCKEEFPYIVELQNKYSEQLQVVFVSTDFKREDAVKFLKEHSVNWTTYINTEMDESFINGISEKWTGAMPFTKIIDKKGEVVASWENSADFDKFERNLKKALNP